MQISKVLALLRYMKGFVLASFHHSIDGLTGVINIKHTPHVGLAY